MNLWRCITLQIAWKLVYFVSGQTSSLEKGQDITAESQECAVQ